MAIEKDAEKILEEFSKTLDKVPELEGTYYITDNLNLNREDEAEEKDINVEELVSDSTGENQKEYDEREKQKERTTNSSTSSAISSQSSFTNKFGTPTTRCSHSGCNNFIASTGDTNCCTIHSRKCAECGKYIDEDATYCMDCISKAVTKTKTQSYSSSGSSSSFSNEYGTATTKCAHPGCNNPIASSGDTNCCTLHSKRCLECGKYIDEDATYCISCLSKALQPSNSKSSGTSSGNYESSGTSSGSYDFSGYSDSMSDEEFDAWLDDVLGS